MKAAWLALSVLLVPVLSPGQSDWSDPQKKDFLLRAEISKTRNPPEGIAGTVRATLSEGSLSHEASIAVIDITQQMQSNSSPEPGFTDRCIYNAAAYELNRILKLNMVPVSVARQFEGKDAVYTWWVDNTLMTEKERYLKKVQPPDADGWNRQMSALRVFDQLIYNMDRNLGNVVIDSEWKIWMIDHTRAFRQWKQLKSKKDLTSCDRVLLQRLRDLDAGELKVRLSDYLSPAQIDAIAARAKLIVKHFDEQVKKRGESAILYDWLPVT